MIDLDIILQFKKKRTIVMLASATILVWAMMCFFQLDRIYMLRYLFTGRNAFWPEIQGFGPLARLMTYALSAVVSFAVILICPSKNIKWVSKMRTCSIDVYIWHNPLYLLIDNVVHFSMVFSFGILGKIAYLLLAVVLSILLSQGGLIGYPIEMLRKYCYEKTIPQR